MKVCPTRRGHAVGDAEPPDLFDVGLEDNIFVRRGRRGTNAQLVEKVVRPAHELDREITTPAEMRAMLGLKGKAEVDFPQPEVAA